jgi:SAM-dependent methyltransferase
VRIVPPDDLVRLVGDVPEGFTRTGQEYLRHLIELCDLRRDERLLDVGCGAGRTALALADYLGPDATYEGFDVVPAAVEWCREQITPAHPNFRFRRVAVSNTTYNPGGEVPASEFTFPYDDASFSIGCAISVFTHMLPDGLERYLREIARCLKPGGRCLLTFFLLDSETRRLIAEDRAELDFRNEMGSYSVNWEHEPEAAVAYPAELVRDLLPRTGLEIDQVHPGAWSGRDGCAAYQDLVVATRPSDT